MRLDSSVKGQDPGAGSRWINRDQRPLLQSILEATDRCYYGISHALGQHVFGPNLDHALPACLRRRKNGPENHLTNI